MHVPGVSVSNESSHDIFLSSAFPNNPLPEAESAALDNVFLRDVGVLCCTQLCELNISQPFPSSNITVAEHARCVTESVQAGIRFACSVASISWGDADRVEQ